MDDQQQSGWQPTRRQLLWAGAAVVLLTVAVLIGYRYGITLWDCIKLLIVPAVIAGGGLWFNRQQRERELEIAREQREREVEIADRRAQDEALQAYLEQIGDLLLNKDGPLRQSKEGGEVRTLARARTLTVLRRLDGERKSSVIEFLYEADLISKDHLILNLRKSDLNGVKLGMTNLSGVDLSVTFLSEASFFACDLSGANLRAATMPTASLLLSNLREANLSGANLSGGADLLMAKLTNANLSGANLAFANLSRADLSGANLRGANLSGAESLTDEQIAAAESLAGATMPDGQKYEDWLKSRGEDGNNSSPS